MKNEREELNITIDKNMDTSDYHFKDNLGFLTTQSQFRAYFSLFQLLNKFRSLANPSRINYVILAMFTDRDKLEFVSSNPYQNIKFPDLSEYINVLISAKSHIHLQNENTSTIMIPLHDPYNHNIKNALGVFIVNCPTIWICGDIGRELYYGTVKEQYD